MAASDKKRVLVKLVYESDWPSDYASKRDIYCFVTQRFKTAFDLGETPIPDPVAITLSSGGSSGSGGGSSGSSGGSSGSSNTRKRYVIKFQGAKFSKSYKFWKQGADGKRLAYSAPCPAPLFAVLKAAKYLPGCIGVTTPAGRSYFFSQPGVARPTGGSGGSGGSGNNSGGSGGSGGSGNS